MTFKQRWKHGKLNRAAQKQAVIDTLSEQEQLTVRAMETAGFIFNPQAANPGLKENLVFTAGEYGYPITFEKLGTGLFVD